MKWYSLVALVVDLVAAVVLNPNAEADGRLALLRRQTASPTSLSSGYTRLGWYSYGERGETTSYTDSLYYTPSYYITSTDDYFSLCPFTYAEYSTTIDAQLTSSVLVTRTSCPIFTSCSGNYLYAESSTSSCSASYVCWTSMLYASLGASSGLSWLYCYPSSSISTGPPLYQVSPPSVTTATPTPISSKTGPAVNPATPTPTTSTPSIQSPPKPNNAGVIAGSVVGGLAVVALAGVAVLYILRRNRRDSAPAAPPASAAPPAPPATPAPYYNGYQTEKPSDQTMEDWNRRISEVPEYVPNAHSPTFR